ncbi:MAG: HD domain-containing protein [Desulfitobacterium hafniense]|nr:HD domain-containing protein [Desulfitobacterium hafniense]
MERINRIVESQQYWDYLKMIEEHERNRVYCNHGFDHAITVARISYIYLLEQGHRFSREIVYASALLHDIGRWVQYENGEDHAIAGVRLAQDILADAGFSTAEIEQIVTGIREHRVHTGELASPLGNALALADDWARDCRNCKVQDTCHKFSLDMTKVNY